MGADIGTTIVRSPSWGDRDASGGGAPIRLDGWWIGALQLVHVPSVPGVFVPHVGHRIAQNLALSPLRPPDGRDSAQKTLGSRQSTG
ncbi:hypothetical protein Acsp03_48930 [Actinomadura sp. NBRC 104412]|nr:hypothetical protein Acsp03_48930 [Actinomadura sp. NBRC 104412]